MGFAMAAPIALRGDYTASDLRSLARRTRDAGQARRLLALAVILDGGSRSDAARVGDVGLQTIRDWVLQFNADGPSGLLTGTPPGRSPRLGAEHRAALARWVEDGPLPAVDGVVRWRLADLAQRLFEEFRIVIGETALGRTLRQMGYRKLSARPRHHAQDPAAAAAFKKTSRPTWRRSPRAIRASR
jgi:transposase